MPPRPKRSAGALAGLWAVLALAVVAAGCGGSSGPSPEELVAQSVEKTAAVESFHVVLNVENTFTPESGLGLTFLDGDIEVPDKMKAQVGGTFQGVPVTTELVIVGDEHYLKIPLVNTWQEVDVGTTVGQFLDPSAGVLPVIDSATDLTDEGSEEIDGVDTHHLAGMVPLAGIAPLFGVEAGAELVPVELWIGKDDLLLRRIRLTGAIEPAESAGAVRTVELSAFDEPVEITAPTASS